MSGRARAKRICQTAVGVFIDPQKAVYDLAREEVGDAFDRFFPERTSPAQRLLAAVLQDFQLPDLDGDSGEHLASVATDLFAQHGLASAELAAIAKPELTAWAADARNQVCRRGLTTRPPGLAEAPARSSDKPPVVVDQAIEARLRALVDTFYAKLIPLTLGSELRSAIDGYQTVLLQDIAARLDHLTRTPEAALPFTIPRPVPDFKGYEKERAAVAKALAGGGAVAISALHGIGGAGKSELARKVAEELAADFPDGQILVDMLGTTQPRSAADAMTDVLLALGAETVDPRTREAEYRSRLKGKRLLILLDNVATAQGLDQLRPPAPAALLITSRTRLALPGVQPIELEHLARPAAKALLAGILPEVSDATLDALAERCADLPLALRVAGAYLQETGASPEAYVEALKERRLAHLAQSAGDIDRPDLDPLLVLGLSYDRLAETDPDLARSFTLLSVFPADFDSAGAAAVLDLDQVETERRFALLHRRNLVLRPVEGRFRLHDLLRELAEDRAADSDATAATARHRTHYLTLLDWCAEEFYERRYEVRNALNTFEIEQASMTSAVVCAIATGYFERAVAGQSRIGSLASALGRHEQAITVTADAANGWRRLAELQPDTYLPTLVVCLSNLSAMLRNIGHREEALKTIEEAVDINLRLSALHPGDFLPKVALSLHNLAAILGDLGLCNRALTAIERAVAIRRHLVEVFPEVNLPDLSISLNNLGSQLRGVGRYEEAIPAYKESIVILRELAKKRPDAFLPSLANSLNNYGFGLSELNRYDEALEATVDAVAINRQLSQIRPDTFQPNLAASLTNLGRDLSKIGRLKDALAAANEATEIYQGLAAARPNSILGNIAIALAMRADCLSELEFKEESLISSAEAVKALLPVFIRYPQAEEHLMRRICTQYTLMCKQLGVLPDLELLAPIIEILDRTEPTKQNTDTP